MMRKLLGVFVCLFLTGAVLSGYAQDLQPTRDKALVNFMVTDFDSVPEEGAEVIIESSDGAVSKKGKTDINGKYKTLLPKSKQYSLVIHKFDRDFKFPSFSIPGNKSRFTMNRHCQIKVVKDYVRSYVLENVYFETNKHNITKDSRPALNELLKAMKSNQDMKIEVAGHTDNVGSYEDNQILSQKRANAVRDYLIEHGISPKRIVAKGYGETKPVASNDTPEGRQKNRRTEIKIIQE